MPKVQRKVDYPVYTFNVFKSGGSGEIALPGMGVMKFRAPMTVEQAKMLLGWNTRSQHLADKKANPENTGKSDEELLDDFREENIFIVEDMNKEPCSCKYNIGNRPFNRDHALELGQEHLQRRWRYNDQPIIIGRTKIVLDGQHTLIGFVLAEQERLRNPALYPQWDGPLTMEVLVITGASEDEEVAITRDNTRARTLSDVINTSAIFADQRVPHKKRLMSKMLDAAIDLLWLRTRASKSVLHKYQTHAESLDFLKKHRKLEEYVRHIFKCNADNKLSKMRLSPGQCAACCYLMACAESDNQDYNPSKGDESLTWATEKKALEFFDDLVKERLSAVQEALGMLQDADSLRGGRSVERLAILANAWNLYRYGEAINKASLGCLDRPPSGLKYRKDSNDNMILDTAEVRRFGEIDRGPKSKSESSEGSAEQEPEPPAEEEIKEQAQHIKEEHVTPVPDNPEIEKKRREAIDRMNEARKAKQQKKLKGGTEV